MTTRTEDKRLLIMALAKAVVCVLLVIIVGYSVLAEVSIDAELLKLIALVLAAYFGVSAKVSHSALKNRRGVRGDG